MNQQEALFQYLLRLGDTNLIAGHRLSELSSKAPFLEEDIANTNMALDLLGQTSAWYQYAVSVEGKGRSEDDLAFLRNERSFYNPLLAEQPNIDFAYVVVKQFILSTFNYHFYTLLTESKDETLAAIAAKSLKEFTYHLRHSAKWMERLGDGTEESHRRVQEALNDLWCYTGELFEMNEIDKVLISAGIASDLTKVKSAFDQTIFEVLQSATLTLPKDVFMKRGSRDGVHTEHLGFLLAEMQHLHRSHPGVKW